MKKWYSLIDKVYRPEKSSKGVQIRKEKTTEPQDRRRDRVSYGENLKENIAQLHHELKTGTYEPQPVLQWRYPSQTEVNVH